MRARGIEVTKPTKGQSLRGQQVAPAVILSRSLKWLAHAEAAEAAESVEEKKFSRSSSGKSEWLLGVPAVFRPFAE